MHRAIEEFIRYAGMDGTSPDESGRLSLQLESGTTVTIEPEKQGDELVVSVFYPAPWKLQELGSKALSKVHYKRSTTRMIAAGSFQDRLVLSTRLNPSRHAPQEIERAALDLYMFAEQLEHQPDQPVGSDSSFAMHAGAR